MQNFSDNVFIFDFVNRLLRDNEIFSKGYQLYYVDDHSQNIATVSNLKIPNLICIFARWGYSDKVTSTSKFNIDDIMDIETVIRCSHEKN